MRKLQRKNRFNWGAFTLAYWHFGAGLVALAILVNLIGVWSEVAALPIISYFVIAAGFYFIAGGKKSFSFIAIYQWVSRFIGNLGQQKGDHPKEIVEKGHSAAALQKAKIFSLILGIILTIIGFFAVVSEKILFGFPTCGLGLILFVWGYPRSFIPSSGYYVKADIDSGNAISKTMDFPRDIALLIAILIACFAQHLVDLDKMESLPKGGIVFFFVAMVLVGFSSFNLMKKDRLRTEVSLGVITPKVEGILLIVLIVFGAFVRIYKLNTFPGGIYQDECWPALDKLAILDGKYTTPITVGWGDIPLGLYFFDALFYKIFGVSEFVMRLPPIIMGLLCIPFFYFIAKKFFHPWVALTVTAFLTASRVHLHNSKIPIFMPIVTFELMSFYFLWRGLETQKKIPFVLAGISLALSLHGYYAGRIIPFIPLVFLLFLILSDPLFLRTYVKNVFLFLIVSGVVFGPMGLWLFNHWGSASGHISSYTVFSQMKEDSRVTVWGSWAKTILMYNWRGDEELLSNPIGIRELDFLGGIFFVLGLGVCLSRWFEPKYNFIFWWFLLGLIPCAFARGAPCERRAIVSLPAVYLLMGAFLDVFVIRAQRWLVHFSKRKILIGILLVIFFVVLCAGNYLAYFGYYAKQPISSSTYDFFAGDRTLVAQRVAQLGASSRSYLSVDYFSHPSVNFLGYHKNTQPSWFNPVDNLPVHDPPDRDAVYFLRSTYLPLKSLMGHYYPNGKYEALPDPFKRTGVFDYGLRGFIYQVKKEDVDSLQGLMGTYHQGQELSGKVIKTQLDKDLKFDWSVQKIQVPFSVVWKGALYSKFYGVHVFRFLGSSHASLWIDDKQIVMRKTDDAGMAYDIPQGQVLLARGGHAIKITCSEDRKGTFVLEWKQPEFQGAKMEFEPIIRNYLTKEWYPHGLKAIFYKSQDWTGEPVAEENVPALVYNTASAQPPLPPILWPPFSVEWIGKIKIDKSGRYIFGTNSNQGNWVYIDNKLIVDNGGDSRDWSYREGATFLNAGVHSIHIKSHIHMDYLGLTLFWCPPNITQKEAVPTEVLYY